MSVPTQGFSAALYYLSTGTRATWGAATAGVHGGAAPANLTLVPNVKDVKIPLGDTELDASTRGTNGWKAFSQGLRETKITIPQLYNTLDTFWVAMLTAQLTRTTIAIAILDGLKTVVGGFGFWADFAVLKGEKGEPLNGNQTWDWEIGPGVSAVPPEVVTLTS